MSRAAFQCPDSGLVVWCDSSGAVGGDRDEWAEWEASADSIAATDAWLAQFGRALRQAIAARGRTIAAFEDALRYCGGVVSDLDPLTWEREALDCDHDGGTRGGVCDQCGAVL